MEVLADAAVAERPSTPEFVRKTQRTTPEQRAAVVALSQDGRSQRYIAKHVHMTRATVSAILSRFEATGSTGSGARSGRPRVTDKASDAAIVATSQADPHRTPRNIRALLDLNCSVDTIDRRLCDAGLHVRAARGKRDHTETH
jgi:transposase